MKRDEQSEAKPAEIMKEHGCGLSPERTAAKPLDMATVRRRLEEARGPQYWRSLEELAQTEGFDELMRDEFPRHASQWMDPTSRRDFLKLMGASLALAGLSGCTRQPDEHIIPYVKQPEELIPGKPLFYATAMTLGGVALPLLAESHMGRPTKLEGNPEHPASRGATDVWAQASILSLYDPERSQALTYVGDVRPWGAFLGAMRGPVNVQRAARGAGFRILTETVCSPTLAEQIQNLLKAYPEARWHQYDPVNRDAAREGARLAFGEYVEPQYRVEKADVILTLDADFLGCGPATLRNVREFAARRRPEARMNRLYAIESTPAPTGGKADHRMAVRASEVEAFARMIAAALGVGVEAKPEGVRLEFVTTVVNDLKAHRGASLVMAGEGQPPVVHALAHAMNEALGNAGNTVVYTQPPEIVPTNQTDSLRALVDDMRSGRVDLLVMLGGNPVYNAPADLDFAQALGRVNMRVHLAPHEDETSILCQWHIPEAHYLESWGDARAHDGTVSIVQPLIAPLYSGKTAFEALAAFTDLPEVNPRELVQQYWKRQKPVADFEPQWRRWLHDGFIPGTAFAPRPVKAKTAGLPISTKVTTETEIIFRSDYSVVDGRFATNAWLQELPRPMTKLTWGNAALVSPAMSEREGLKNGDVVELEFQGRKTEAPVLIQPGHADHSVTVHLGYGRRRAGHVGSGVGFDAYALRTTGSPSFSTGLTVRKTGRTQRLAVTQNHQQMHGRHMVIAGTAEQYQRDPEFVKRLAHEPAREMTLYPEHKYEGHAWGMAIDVSACVGCNACVVACQAENNIPVVGYEQVLVEREMHWLRIDTYYEGPLDTPEAVHFQPVPCMHCENAPCEPVCPVAATAHSSEGLNDMVYNRCVGTRYCQNNCPYKVRRFNFLLYSDFASQSLMPMRNPDVTVRSRGVMEKCTYCVQRINEGRIRAEIEGRRVKDGEVQTACQQACAAGAIVFGDINDPGSRVSRLRAQQRNYGLLAELNTRPRTTYLAEIRNPRASFES